jgi:2-(1,2-epoxy-1,2-dihydrophenyl)acetyl-CoA isomerase
MKYESIRFGIEDGVAVLTLDRPDKLNALTPAMADEMRHALGHCDEARAVLINGEGRAFCSGTDLSVISAHTSLGDGAYASLVDHYNPLLLDIAEHELPVVSAVSGAAAGIGCSLALACDFCIASADAYFLLAFVNIGLVPDGGASWQLSRLIGKARAAEMTMLGEKLPAAKAIEWGLIHKCVAGDALAFEARSLAERLANGPTKALGAMKNNLAHAQQHSLASTMQAEAEAQCDVAATDDAKEGIGAFLEKRKPEFKGR